MKLNKMGFFKRLIIGMARDGEKMVTTMGLAAGAACPGGCHVCMLNKDEVIIYGGSLKGDLIMSAEDVASYKTIGDAMGIMPCKKRAMMTKFEVTLTDSSKILFSIANDHPLLGDFLAIIS